MPVGAQNLLSIAKKLHYAQLKHIGFAQFAEGDAGDVDNEVVFLQQFFFYQSFLDVHNGVVGVDKLVVIEAAYAPYEAQNAQQGVIVGEDVNAGPGAL